MIGFCSISGELHRKLRLLHIACKVLLLQISCYSGEIRGCPGIIEIAGLFTGKGVKIESKKRHIGGIGNCKYEKQFFKDVREFLIIIAGGIFTGACVTFLILIQEYLYERRAALRNLYRLTSLIKEKFQRVRFFVPQIVEKIAIMLTVVKENSYEYSFS